MSDPTAKESSAMPQVVRHFDFQKLAVMAILTAVIT